MRRAFTLLELLLVLALMVAIAAVAVPAIGLFSQSQLLRDAAQLVRGEWARARVQAMKSGRIHVFRYELSGARYTVDFWVADDDALEAGDNRALARPQEALPQRQADFDLDQSGKQLPDGVRFYLGDAVDDARSVSLQWQMGGASSVGPANIQLSRPVLFYSDGTTSTAEVTLVNERGRAVTISLRGLTGVAQVSDVYSLQGNAL